MGNSAIQRHMIFDYLNVGMADGEDYVRLNRGVVSLDENPAAQMDTTVYIGDKAASGEVKSYQPQFPFETNIYTEEKAVMKLYDVGRNQKTGSDAEAEYIRIETFFKIEGKVSTFKARKFRVAIEVANIAGGGGEKVKVTGNLHGIGDFIDGEFDTIARTFTAAENATEGELGVLSVLSEAGTNTGDTKITVTPGLGARNTYKYKTAVSPSLPTYGQVCTTGWTAWAVGADIAATAGNKVVVAEVDADNKAVKTGMATVVTKA